MALSVHTNEIQLASLMDSVHQPWMLLHAWKPDQFSQFIHLCDLMATLGEGNGKVNKSGRKELHMINNIGGREVSERS